jgi:hypothetical protein
MADLLGSAIGPAEIRKAALAPLSPTSERAAALLARLIIANSGSVAVILAGLADDEVLAKLLALMDLDPHSTP